MIRPLVMLSSSEICSARRIGWCNETCATAKPILMRLVAVASAAAKLSGST